MFVPDMEYCIMFQRSQDKLSSIVSLFSLIFHNINVLNYRIIEEKTIESLTLYFLWILMNSSYRSTISDESFTIYACALAQNYMSDRYNFVLLSKLGLFWTHSSQKSETFH